MRTVYFPIQFPARIKRINNRDLHLFNPICRTNPQEFFWTWGRWGGCWIIFCRRHLRVVWEEAAREARSAKGARGGKDHWEILRKVKRLGLKWRRKADVSRFNYWQATSSDSIGATCWSLVTPAQIEPTIDIVTPQLINRNLSQINACLYHELLEIKLHFVIFIYLSWTKHREPLN